jgi:hypothetical protein
VILLSKCGTDIQVATQEAKSLIGFTTDVADVAFPFEVLIDCYSQIFCLINRFQDMIPVLYGIPTLNLTSTK